MKAIGIAKGDRIDFGEYNIKKIKDDVKKNLGAKYQIERLTHESVGQRKFYEGGVIDLWIFLDGNDWRDSKIHDHYHNEANKEFNGEIIIRNGKPEKMGLSSKGKLTEFDKDGKDNGIMEKVIEYLEENYAIDRTQVLDNEKYKYWRDVLYPQGGPETYIEYLLSIGKLKLPDPEYLAHELRDEIENESN